MSNLKLSLNQIYSKGAFTLAEVLITLAIIGIVAAMTIPSLMNKTNDAELNTALKKVYSELSNATNQIVQENGGTFKGVITADTNYFNPDLLNAYTSHLKIAKACMNARTEGCWHPLTTNGGTWKTLSGGSTDGNASGSGAVLNNGTMINFIAIDSQCAFKGIYYQKSAICAWIVVDVNGFKLPNMLGKDVFYFNVLENKLEPWGAPDSVLQTCSISSTQGIYCTASKLTQ